MADINSDLAGQDVAIIDEISGNKTKVTSTGQLLTLAEISGGNDGAILDGLGSGIKAGVSKDNKLYIKDVKGEAVLFRILRELRTIRMHLEILTEVDFEEKDDDERMEI